MRFDKTMFGNPTGEQPQQPKKPKSERIGGLDFGGSMGEMFNKASNKAPETPEERARRLEQNREQEAILIAAMREKIGNQPSAPTANRPFNPREARVMQAVTPEQIAAMQAAQQEAATKPKIGFWKRLLGGS